MTVPFVASAALRSRFRRSSKSKALPLRTQPRRYRRGGRLARHCKFLPARANMRLFRSEQMRQLPIRDAHLLPLPRSGRLMLQQCAPLCAPLPESPQSASPPTAPELPPPRSAMILQLMEEPGIDLREIRRSHRHAHSRFESTLQVNRNSFRVRRRKLGPKLVHAHLDILSVDAKSETDPPSNERSAFCIDSLNVRPIDIASPTAFICVVSVSSAPANFSNVNRGSFVTT